ncbi:PLD nuclease N-terminal domain-containing protein [Amycolatopsis samaneae]|uniref:PLD nuclease N-terminal domain-containing protein n=1 Tax=Amycolatopsis samaneae TaxID=664691 RepID=A0ABW5G889_9PSEU
MPHHLVHVLAEGQGALTHGLGLGLGLVLALAGLAYLGFFLWALFSILGARIGCGATLLWLIVIFSLPFIGSLLWYVVGRKSVDPHLR